MSADEQKELWREWSSLPREQQQVLARSLFCYAFGLLEGSDSKFFDRLQAELVQEQALLKQAEASGRLA